MTNKEADHIINKEVFEFSYAEADQAFNLQREMNDALLFRIHGIINSAFEESFSPAESIRIEKLEIDLGEIPFTQLDNLMPSKLYGRLKEKLQMILPERKWSMDADEEIETCDDVKTVEYFLLTGGLPWWEGKPNFFLFNETVKTILQNDPEQIKTVLSAHIHNEIFLKRLIYQSNNEVYQRLFELIPGLNKLIATVEMVLYSCLNASFLLQKKEGQSENTSLAIDAPQQVNGHVGSFRNKTVEEFWHEKQTTFNKEILQQIIELAKKKAFAVTEQKLRSQLKEKILFTFGEMIELDKLEESMEQLISTDFCATFEKFKEETIASELPDKLYSPDLSTLAFGEKILIENAGLVLLSAFLPALFNELNWIKDGKFINKESQFKGIFLLHYIATGETAAPEYTLQLNKLLVGLKLEEPIPFTVKLTDKEKGEADQLLNDMITHWKALKSSSIEGFRGSFLLREGLLSTKGTHRLLQVERKGYDILLEHIPWSWRTVQFAWMDIYIDTEW